jgi:hypothetical protein
MIRLLFRQFSLKSLISKTTTKTSSRGISRTSGTKRYDHHRSVGDFFFSSSSARMNLSAQKFTFWYRFSTGKSCTLKPPLPKEHIARLILVSCASANCVTRPFRLKTTSPGFVSCEPKTPAMYVFCNGATTEKSGTWKQPPWCTPLGGAEVCFSFGSSEIPRKWLR